MNKTHKYLMEYISRDVIEFIFNENNLPIDTAMELFFESKLFKILQDSDSELYTESASYIYELYKEEKEIGKFI